MVLLFFGSEWNVFVWGIDDERGMQCVYYILWRFQLDFVEFVCDLFFDCVGGDFYDVFEVGIVNCFGFFFCQKFFVFYCQWVFERCQSVGVLDVV